MTEENINQAPEQAIDTAVAPQETEAASAPARQTEQVKDTSNWEQRYTDIQKWANSISEENAGLKSQLESINPKLDLVDKLAGVFDHSQNESLSIEERINQSLPRLEEQQQALMNEIAQERAEKTQILQYLNAQKQEADYNQFVDQYKPMFNTEEDFVATEQALMEKFPTIVEDVQTGRRSLDSFMNEYLGTQFATPDSAVRKSIEEAQKARVLQKQFNHLNPSATIPGAGNNPQAWNPIQILPSE